jgi:Ca-activated chloride channel family protein
MDYSFHCANALAWYLLVPLLVLLFVYRWCWHKPLTYRYSLATVIRKQVHSSVKYIPLTFFVMRAVALVLLAFLVTRPQLLDIHSQVRADGVDIVMVLDVSGSMLVFDDPNDQQTRLAVVKREAARFIERRPNDPIALVIFGRDAITRCPLTLDKKLLLDLVHSLEIGIVNQNATALGTAMAMGAHRLKNSQAKSGMALKCTQLVWAINKVVILMIQCGESVPLIHHSIKSYYNVVHSKLVDNFLRHNLQPM